MLIPVILSGGAGTRLWPVSRASHPKPFIRFPDGESLLQKTMQRALLLNDAADVLTVTNQEFYFKTKDEYALLKNRSRKTSHFLLEPVGRNTAPAIAMAAWYALQEQGDEAVLLVLPADHLIQPAESFVSAVNTAYQAAKKNHLVTFGIKPNAPETGFGYIHYEKKEGGDVCAVREFIEKPSLERAEEFLISREYLWNSGMFCFKASVILDALERYANSIFTFSQTCWQAAHQLKNDAIHLDAETFQAIPDLSIDYAVMEKAESVVVVPCDFEWNDIGSWSAMSAISSPDALQNSTVGEAVLIDVKNSYVQSHHRLIAAVGVQDLIIVDTEDALLVANRNRSQDVKEVVHQLKGSDHDSYKLHRTVFRPWGSYTVLEESERFKIKRIVVKTGASLSLQMHRHRSEHWVVVSGAARVTKDDETFILNPNESTFISIGCRHRLENAGLVDLILIEVQTGEYLGEDDIVRFDDRYGRAAQAMTT